jgi:hypothetical protein
MIAAGDDPQNADRVDRASSFLASFGEWPHGVIRLGAGLCVAAITLSLPFAIDDGLRGNDSWADHNSSLTYMARSVPPADAVGSPGVVEDARLWMPNDAEYRIVTPDDLVGPLQWAFPDFIAAFLLPRREVQSEDAEWIFCVRCDSTTLGSAYEVLSDSGDGILFGRVQR